MAKMGRPHAVIDKVQFEAICKLHATITEACSVFKVDDNTLNAWCRRHYGSTFSEVSKGFQGELKVSMRRKLAQQALEKDNIAALLFWCKNHLGMSDHVTQTVGHDQSRPAIVKYIWQAKGDKANEAETDQYGDVYDKPNV